MLTQFYKFQRGIFTLFIFFSIFNLYISYQFNSVWIFVYSEILICFYLNDLKQSQFQFNIYQMMLLFSILSIGLGYGTNKVDNGSYNLAFHIHSFHFIILALGYNLIKYKNVININTTHYRQSKFIVLFFIFTLVFSMYTMIFPEKTYNYNDQFRTFEETQNLPIYKIAANDIISNFNTLFLFTQSNPFIYSIYSLIISIIGFFSSGIKAGVVISAVLFLICFQLYIRKFSIQAMTFFLPFSIFCISILIATTTLRLRGVELTFINFMNLKVEDLEEYLKVFPKSPELNQINYTSQVITLIKNDENAYRYGWDYYRFFLYPFKSHYNDFRYASYNEFAHIHDKEIRNAGLYIGLAGELFWNFGFLFPIFSFIHGIGLKYFQNWSMKGKFEFATYFMVYHTVLWHYYRGQGNALIMVCAFFFVAFFLFKLIFQKYFPKFILP
jgi:hypothetical protein